MATNKRTTLTKSKDARYDAPLTKQNKTISRGISKSLSGSGKLLSKSAKIKVPKISKYRGK